MSDQSLINLDEYESALNDLRKAGFRLSEYVYMEALKMGRQLK